MAQQGGPSGSLVHKQLPVSKPLTKQAAHPLSCQQNEPHRPKYSRTLPITAVGPCSKAINRATTWPHGRAGATWSLHSLQGSTPDSPPFDGEHHTQENDDEHEEACDHSGHLHGVVHLLLGLHGVRILGGSTLQGKGEEKDVEKAHTRGETVMVTTTACVY